MVRADYSLRSCPGCSAHLAVPYQTEKLVYCARCEPKQRELRARPIEAGNRVRERWDEPTRNGHMPTEYVVVDRNGDTLTLQKLGFPDKRWEDHVSGYVRTGD